MPQNYRTTLDEASILIEAFVYNAKVIAENVAIGATLGKWSLYGEPTIIPRTAARVGLIESLGEELFNGHMGWFCQNEFNIPGYPKFFLSFEENDSYQKGDVPKFPDMKNLRCPSETFTLPKNTADIKDWLDNHTIDPVANPGQYNDRVIERPMVSTFAAMFSAKGPTDDQRLPLNNYPFSFFENEQSRDIEAFFKTPGLVYVRYYFGYSDSTPEIKKSNRIRVILVAVDKEGKNIFAKDKASAVVTLQHSWPPPPPIE